METIERVIKNKYVVVTDQLYSMEYYRDIKTNEISKQVLCDISLKVKEGEVCSIIGNQTYEIKLLMDIISNTKPYQSGKCVLNERGMMKRKRHIVEDVFYIASTNMLYHNMTVLEYLTFVTNSQKGNLIQRQLNILNELCDLGLDYISLTHIMHLSPAEKTLVLMVCAYYAKTPVVMMNLPRITYDQKALLAFSKIVELLKKENRSFIYATHDTHLANMISNHIILLKEGQIIENLNYLDFVTKYDLLKYTMTLNEGCMKLPLYIFNHYKVTQKQNQLYFYEQIDLTKVIKELTYYCEVMKVEKNIPNVTNATISLLGGEINV